VGHGMGLDVGPSYKPCWDHITRVNPTLCHVSESMFYIQFGPYIGYFYSI